MSIASLGAGLAFSHLEFRTHRPSDCCAEPGKRLAVCFAKRPTIEIAERYATEGSAPDEFVDVRRRKARRQHVPPCATAVVSNITSVVTSFQTITLPVHFAIFGCPVAMIGCFIGGSHSNKDERNSRGDLNDKSGKYSKGAVARPGLDRFQTTYQWRGPNTAAC